MNLCSNEHEEICYEGRYCPLCQVMVEKDNLQKQLDKFNEEEGEK